MGYVVLQIGSTYAALTDGAVAPTLPSAPTSLSATAISSSQINLGWSAGGGGGAAASYVVERSLDGSTGWSQVSNPSSPSYSDTGLAGSTLFYYRVKARNAIGDSTYCTAASATTQAAPVGVPAVPTSLTLGVMSDSEVALTWLRGDDTDTAILVERAPDVAGSPGTFAQVASLPAHSNIWTDVSLWQSTAYWWRVRAQNANGYSAYSSQQTATTTSIVVAAADLGGISLPVATNFTATVSGSQQVNLAWTDTNTGSYGYRLERSDDSGLTYFPLSTTKTTTSHTDSHLNFIPTPALVPGNTYKYRLRCYNNYGRWSPFAGPATATVTARTGGAPIEPTNLVTTANTDTTVSLAWTDTSGGTASFKIERAGLPLWGSAPSYSQVGTTTAGTTTFTDSTASAFLGYFYRVRATNVSGDSGYCVRAVARTSHPVRSGGAGTFDIGPGQTYTSLGAFNWDSLGPGDTVRIHCNTGLAPYYERLVVTRRGTAAAPITIIGVPDPGTGALPIIDGTNAVTNSQFAIGYTLYETYGLIFVGTHATNSNVGPGYLVFQNLEVRNAKTPGTFTDYQGTSMTWDYAASAFYIQKGDHITITNCKIHDTGNGIFTGDHGDYNIYCEDLTVQNCTMYNHGNVGSYTEHGLYLQGQRSLVQGCKIGPPLSGALGNNLKDRGTGTIIRANCFLNAPAAHHLDLVENQDGYALLGFLPEYRKTLVYGNTFQDDGSVWTSMHYGYDHYNPMAGRKGVLYFYNNTFVNISDGGYNPVILFALGYQVNVPMTWETVDARNNILLTVPVTSGHAVGSIGLLETNGVGYFGKNWISSNHVTSGGMVGGLSNLLVGDSSNNPGLVNVPGLDWRLTSGAAARNQASALADVIPGGIAIQYVEPASTKSRSSVFDLGAFEYGA